LFKETGEVILICKEIVNRLNKVLVEGGNHHLKCTPV